MEKAARKAGQRLRRDFGEVEHLQVSRKGPADFVSKADKRAERTLVDELQKARPDWGFLLEEGGEIEGDPMKPRWIIDPLDGTSNFLHGIPHFAISIAVEEPRSMANGLGRGHHRPHLSADHRRKLSGPKRIAAPGCMTAPARFGAARPRRKPDRHRHPVFRAWRCGAVDAIYRRARAAVAGIRRFGSAALDLAWVASGRYEGFWESGLQPWDTAAGCLLVREAGGFVTDLTHLERLEAESIHIMREVVAEAEKPVMLYSVGKDSAVMLHLARKAFYPSPPPFPLLHVDTTWKFQEMYKLRDRMAQESGMELLVYQNPEAKERGINPFDHGPLHTDMWKTEGLKQALDLYGFDAAFGGARRDEEKSRAKERIFSFRTASHGWDPKNQRPELWNLYNARKKPRARASASSRSRTGPSSTSGNISI
jgi:fructose-1,6-bisphosphatase/inositol monophosphatase family enzyme